MADSEDAFSAQTQTSPTAASDSTTSQQCTSVPANVVEAINKSNDFVPALFALPCDRFVTCLFLRPRTDSLQN